MAPLSWELVLVLFLTSPWPLANLGKRVFYVPSWCVATYLHENVIATSVLQRWTALVGDQVFRTASQQMQRMKGRRTSGRKTCVPVPVRPSRLA